MSDPTDIRSLLTSRSRAKVAPRDSSLSHKTSEEKQDNFDDEETRQLTSNQSLEQLDFSSLQTELDNLPQVGKRLAIHLEQQVRADLLQLCDRYELTPEIFLEATLALLQDKPDFVEAAVDEAKIRLAKRKRAGLLRRTIAIAQKYSS